MTQTITKKEKKTPNRRRGNRTALITAPLATDTTFLSQLLDEEGVKTFAVDELTQPAASLRDMVQDAIDRSDMVFVVLPKQASQENVLVELGFALACKKPTLIIADEDVTLSGIAAEIPCLRTRLGNTEAIRFGVTQFLAAPHSKKPPEQAARKRTRPLGAKADGLLTILRKERESDLELLVKEALGLSGVEMLSQRKHGRDEGIDIALWSDDLEPLVSNPFFIQVKENLQGKNDLDLLAERVRAYGQGRVHWALVIYRHAAEASFDTAKHSHPYILCITAKDFLTSLRDSSFAELVIKLRNDRAHGRG
jgi:hypothetical protein